MNDNQRRQQMESVLEVVCSKSDFEKAEVVAEAEIASSQMVARILNQLVAEQTLGVMISQDDDSANRYAWLVDQSLFDQEEWVKKRIQRGNQVTNAPKDERPRERLLQRGAAELTNSELLAILIRSGRQGESAVQAGQSVSQYFEEQWEVLPQQSPAEMKAISRVVSEVAYCQIMAGVELGRRVAESINSSPPQFKITSTRIAVEYCQEQFSRLAREATQEEFHIVTLDTKLQPVRTRRITIGTLDASLVHPREVFRAAIRDSASAILLVHNHPSGDPTPSRQDFEVTDRLRRAGEILGIKVIDHVVVSSGGCVSLAETER